MAVRDRGLRNRAQETEICVKAQRETNSGSIYKAKERRCWVCCQRMTTYFSRLLSDSKLWSFVHISDYILMVHRTFMYLFLNVYHVKDRQWELRVYRSWMVSLGQQRDVVSICESVVANNLFFLLTCSENMYSHPPPFYSS